MHDASTYDVVCVNCGNTDHTPGGWGLLAEPCPCVPEVVTTDAPVVMVPGCGGESNNDAS